EIFDAPPAGPRRPGIAQRCRWSTGPRRPATGSRAEARSAVAKGFGKGPPCCGSAAWGRVFAKTLPPTSEQALAQDHAGQDVVEDEDGDRALDDRTVGRPPDTLGAAAGVETLPARDERERPAEERGL